MGTPIVFAKPFKTYDEQLAHLRDDYGLEIKEGIILETEDMNFRCRLTISEIISKILDNDRIELANTLFGEKI